MCRCHLYDQKDQFAHVDIVTLYWVSLTSVFQQCPTVKLIISSKTWSSEVGYLIMLLSRVMAKLCSTSKKTELTRPLEMKSHTSAWHIVQTMHDVCSWSYFCCTTFLIFLIKPRILTFPKLKLLSFQSLINFIWSLCPASEIYFRSSLAVPSITQAHTSTQCTTMVLRTRAEVGIYF